MPDTMRPARVVPPGDILKTELESRGWTQKELAEIMKWPPQAISELLSGEKRITAEIAFELARTLGTTTELWLNLESQFQRWKAEGTTGSTPSGSR